LSSVMTADNDGGVKEMYSIPDHFYNKTVDWLTDSAAFDKTLIADFYQAIYPAETLELRPPGGIDPPRWGMTCRFDEAFVAVIPNGRVVTGNGYVVTPNHKRLLDVELDYPDYRSLKLGPPEYRAETVATLIWGWNIDGIGTHSIYGHWFFDILPRLHLLEQSGIPIDHYLIGKLNHPFQYESLSMLGLPLEKLIQVDRNDFHLVARKLVVPAVPLMVGKSPRWAYEFIRTRLRDEQPIERMVGFERIYVSRQDAGARFVVNEDEVMNVLQQKGFRRIVPTPLTTYEKVALFSSAEVVVAPFGSSNVNIAFCNPGTKLFELSPRTVVDNYFWKICNHAGVDYYEVVCDIEFPPKPFVGADNIVVNIDKLLHVLALAGI
jgi:hypothetical protein